MKRFTQDPANRALTMTKCVFEAAAEMVQNILKEKWTDDPPAWTKECYAHLDATPGLDRAVFIAEAFIILFSASNPRFDQTRFLVACGLVEKPIKAKRR